MCGRFAMELSAYDVRALVQQRGIDIDVVVPPDHGGKHVPGLDIEVPGQLSRKGADSGAEELDAGDEHTQGQAVKKETRGAASVKETKPKPKLNSTTDGGKSSDAVNDDAAGNGGATDTKATDDKTKVKNESKDLDESGSIKSQTTAEWAGNKAAGSPVKTLAEQTPQVKHSLNVAPHDNVYVYKVHDGEHALQLMNWSLVPPFMRDRKQHPFNTRAESLHPLKSMYHCAETNRGIVFMQGYYEWKKEGSQRIPHYVKSKSEPLLCVLAIYTDETFSIITTKAAEDIAYIHARMPVVVDFKDVRQWVEGSFDEAIRLLQPKAGLQSYLVSPEVNRVGVNRPGLNEPVKQKAVQDFFKRKSEQTKDAKRRH